MTGDPILSGYRGHVDAIEPIMSGWVTEIARPAHPVAVILWIDGRTGVSTTASLPRPDVAEAGFAGPHSGFSLALPADFLNGGEHEIALLLSDGRNLRLPGLPPRVALGPVRADLVSAGDARIEAVCELLQRTDREAGFDPDHVTPEHAAQFNAVAPPDEGFLYYARAGDRLVGYGRLDRGRGEAAALGVVALTVVEAYRRKGIGEALMRALLRGVAQTPGFRQVWLSVRPDNTPAIRLYEKLGFAREANHPMGSWAVPGEITMVCLTSGRAG